MMKSILAPLFLSLSSSTLISAFLIQSSLSPPSFHLPNVIQLYARKEQEHSFGNLVVNESDMDLLRNMQSRIATIPVLIIQGSSSVVLPGEKFEFSSNDPRFHSMIDQVLKLSNDGDSSIGIIGAHPLHPERSLSLGVTVPITRDTVSLEKNTMKIKGATASNRFEVQGEPWLDEMSESFYWCHADITERQDVLGRDEQKQLKQMAAKIPGLVQQWLDLMVKYQVADFAMLRKVYKHIGPMPTPDDHFKTANWVAALVNSCMLQEVCMDIRAAMLACRNNLDRVNLAVAAIENSIRYLKTAY